MAKEYLRHGVGHKNCCRGHYNEQPGNRDLLQLQAWLGFPPYPPGVTP